MKEGRYFGEYGGMFVPETLVNAVLELEETYEKYKDYPDFVAEKEYYLSEYAGRQTPLYFAERMTQELGGGKVYLKREDLNHTGSHKLNNVIGQMLLAKRMGQKAHHSRDGSRTARRSDSYDSGAVQFAVRRIYGRRGYRAAGAQCFQDAAARSRSDPCTYRHCTLKDATSEAIRDWAANFEDTYYVIGSVVGPSPYPRIVRDFQSVIGIETKEQIMKKEGRLPDI